MTREGFSAMSTELRKQAHGLDVRRDYGGSLALTKAADVLTDMAMGKRGWLHEKSQAPSRAADT